MFSGRQELFDFVFQILLQFGAKLFIKELEEITERNDTFEIKKEDFGKVLPVWLDSDLFVQAIKCLYLYFVQVFALVWEGLAQLSDE